MLVAVGELVWGRLVEDVLFYVAVMVTAGDLLRSGTS